MREVYFSAVLFSAWLMNSFSLSASHLVLSCISAASWTIL